MRTFLPFLFLVCLFQVGSVMAAEPSCKPDGQKATVTTDAGVLTIDAGAPVLDCVVSPPFVYLALGNKGVATWRIKDAGSKDAADKKGAGEGAAGKDAGGAELVSTSAVGPGEVVRLRVEGGKLFAVMASFQLVPLALGDDGGVAAEPMAALLAPGTGSAGTFALAPVGTTSPVPAGTATASKAPPATAKATSTLVGKVIEVHPDEAIIDLGATDGVTEGMRFEIRSAAIVKKYDLASKGEVEMSSDEITAVVQVVQVSEDRCLAKLGRGNRAEVGDRALATERALTATAWFPGYQRNLNRIRTRIAPFVGLSTMSVGVMGNLMYDRAFSFPLRVEAGLRNYGLVFGDQVAAPFQFDLIPSFDTDFFEVGIGAGYSYSAHDKKRGFTFLQKVRLGTVDGLNFTMWNSFVYQQKHPEDFSWGWGSEDTGYSYGYTVGEDCYYYADDWSKDETGSEFDWNGFDAELNVPVSERISLLTHWAYSQAGWFIGEIGMRTLVSGNGGDGTLIIPVTIGGAAVEDYTGTPRDDFSCDPDTLKTVKKSVTDWSNDTFAGPIVSIGLDYRWK